MKNYVNYLYLLSLFVATTVHAQSRASIIAAVSQNAVVLDPVRVLRGSQGLLDYHVQKKLAMEPGTDPDPQRPDLCFIKVPAAQLIVAEYPHGAVELYLKACPKIELPDSVNSFRMQNTHAARLRLGPAISTAASEQWHAFKAGASKDTWAELDQGLVADLEARLPGDSVGQLIFMELNGSPVNVGYIDSALNLRALCSGAWQHLCYFDGKTFVLGSEFRQREWDNEALRNDWEWEKQYTDFTEVLASAVFSRGNDDYRQQALFELTLPKGGVTVPITENWYRYFRSHPQTRDLVAPVMGDDGKIARTYRSRREWNYQTAIHPVHVIATRDRQSGQSAVRVYVGAEVIYDSAFDLEPTDCQEGEAEGYAVYPVDAIAESNRGEVLGEYLSPFMRKLIGADLHRLWDDSRGYFQMQHGTYLISQNNPYMSEVGDRDQSHMLPELSDIEGINIQNMWMEFDIDPTELGSAEQAFVIAKGAYKISGHEDLDDENAAPGRLLSTLSTPNLVKKFLVLRQDSAGNLTVNLKGFNTNEFMANNTATMTLESGLEFLWDPDAAYKIWDGRETLPLQSGHVVSRTLAKDMQSLKAAYNAAHYKKQSAQWSQQRYGRDLLAVAGAFEQGLPVLDEERDLFLSRVHSSLAMIGGDRAQAGIRWARGIELSNFLYNARNIPLTISASDYFPRWHSVAMDWVFDDDGNYNPVLELIEIDEEKQQNLFHWIEKVREIERDINALLEYDQERVVESLFKDQDFYSSTVADSESLESLSATLRNVRFNGFFEVMTKMDDQLRRLAVSTPEQRAGFGRDIPEALKPFGIYLSDSRFAGLDRVALTNAVRGCYGDGEQLASPDAIMQALEACTAAYEHTFRSVESILTDLGVPHVWQLNRQ